MNDDIPTSRPYTHLKCQGVTVVSGDDFVTLADPFSRVSLTICATCEGAYPLGEFKWQDTGENMVEARQRLARAFPPHVRFLNSALFYAIWAIACGIVAILFSPLTPRKHLDSPWIEVILFAAGTFIGLVLYFGFLARPLTSLLVGQDFDVRKLK